MLGRATSAVSENPEDVSAEAPSSAWMGLAGSAHAFAMPWQSLQVAAESLFSGQLESAGISGQMQGQLHSAVTWQDRSACVSLLPGRRASGDLTRAAPAARQPLQGGVAPVCQSGRPPPSPLFFSSFVFLLFCYFLCRWKSALFDSMDIQSMEFSRPEYWSG